MHVADDARMTQFGQKLGFAEKTGFVLCVEKDFERNGRTGLLINGSVNGPHSPLARQLVDRKPPQDDTARRKLFQHALMLAQRRNFRVHFPRLAGWKKSVERRRREEGDAGLETATVLPAVTATMSMSMSMGNDDRRGMYDDGRRSVNHHGRGPYNDGRWVVNHHGRRPHNDGGRRRNDDRMGGLMPTAFIKDPLAPFLSPPGFNPHMVRAGRMPPVTSHPHVPVAIPDPMTGHPDMPTRRCDGLHLNLRRRRRNHDSNGLRIRALGQGQQGHKSSNDDSTHAVHGTRKRGRKKGRKKGQKEWRFYRGVRPTFFMASGKRCMSSGPIF